MLEMETIASSSFKPVGIILEKILMRFFLKVVSRESATLLEKTNPSLELSQNFKKLFFQN